MIVSSSGGVHYNYDTLSRLTSTTTPESATTSFTYNSDGNPLTRVRPAPNQSQGSVTVTTTYAYDQLHRLNQTTYSDSTPPVYHYYDESSIWGVTPANRIGRLTHTIAANGYAASIHSYDSMGRVLYEWQATPLVAGSSSYVLSYLYDLMGNMIYSNNGVNIGFGYTYDAAGRLSSMTSSLSDSGHPGTLLSATKFNALGGLLSLNLGNGLTQVNGFDARGRMLSSGVGTNCTPSGNPTTCSAFTYLASGMTYRPNGSVATANDSVNGNSTFAYDDFSRLATSSKAGQSLSFAYDRYGNRTTQTVTSGSGNTVYLTFTADNNRIDGYCYDPVGNLLKEGLCPIDYATVPYKYDAENRMIVAPGATYQYDAFGRRVRTTVSGVTTDFLYDQSAHAIVAINGSGSPIRDEVYAGNMHLATYANNTTHFNHGDWLGTERKRTDVSGATYTDCTSAPFGDGQSCSGNDPSTAHFTGLATDAETGFSHTLFRQYHPTQGRWTSPDPLGGNIGDPQSLNRYAYVTNDPVNWVDPLGLNEADPGSGTVCRIGGWFEVPCSMAFGPHGLWGGALPGGLSETGFALDNLGNPHPYTLAFTGTGFAYMYADVCMGTAIFELGLPEFLGSERPTNLPQGTPEKYWGPFAEGFGEATKQLGKKKCGAFYGGQGASTMKGTEYRFLELSRPSFAAQTNSPTSVFINPAGAYITYSPVPGIAGPFGRFWTQRQFRAFILLHELAHQLSPITGFGPDANSSSFNQAQSGRVLQVCF